MGGKWLELMKEIAPSATRIGYIHHPAKRPHRGLVRAAQAAAPPLKIDLVPLPIHNADESRPRSRPSHRVDMAGW